MFVDWSRPSISRPNMPFLRSNTALDGLLIKQSNHLFLSVYTIRIWSKFPPFEIKILGHSCRLSFLHFPFPSPIHRLILFKLKCVVYWRLQICKHFLLYCAGYKGMAGRRWRLMSQSIPTGYIPPGNPLGLAQKHCLGGRDLTFESCLGAGNSTRAGIFWKFKAKHFVRVLVLSVINTGCPKKLLNNGEHYIVDFQFKLR